MQPPPLAIDPLKLDLKQLPYSLQELVMAIGLAPALALATRFPGISLYVPSKAKAEADHPIAATIGAAAMASLCHHYGPGYLTVPKLDRALAQIKHQLVKELREQRVSHRQIALALNYTERHVIRIATRDGGEQRNGDLFDE